MAFTGSYRMSFAINFHTTRFCFSLLHLIFFHTPQEIISTFGMFYVLNSEIDSLGDDSVSQLFVDNDSNSSSCHIEYSSCFPMVVLVWHSFVNVSISFHINDITHFVRFQVCRQMFNACFPEPL